MPAVPKVTEHVRAFAARHGVDLADVSGSGHDGIITALDVAKVARARAEQRIADELRESRERAEIRQLEAATETHRRSGAGWARNPLVDQMRSRIRAEGGTQPREQPPTLFAVGDLPAFTASGIPASALLDVPWQARHAMAAANSAAEAYEIQADCGVADAVETAETLYGNHPGNRDYADRVQRWRLRGMSAAELRDSTEPGATGERERRDHEFAEAFNRSLRSSG